MAHDVVTARPLRVSTLSATLYRRNPPLATVSAAFASVLLATLVGIAVDPRTVAGDPTWLKPAKFAASLALATGTLAWLSPHVPMASTRLRRLSLGIGAGAVLEFGLIALQAARAVPSHFNDASALDAAIYAAMGGTIVGVLALVCVVTVVTWRRPLPVEPAFAWGVRLGLVMFVLGSVEGATMVASGAGAVGPGPTLPVLGWALGGDLRVAHFVGIHGLQVLPAAGFLLGRAGWPRRRALGALFGVAVLQGGLVGTFLLHALRATGS